MLLLHYVPNAFKIAFVELTQLKLFILCIIYKLHNTQFVTAVRQNHNHAFKMTK